MWLMLPDEMNATDMLEKAIEKDVAYVPGEYFHVEDRGRNTIRLSFSVLTPPEIKKGIRRLSSVIKKELKISV